MTNELEQTTRTAEAFAVGLASGAIIIIAVGVLLIIASRRPFPTTVVMALTVLATLALVGYAVAGEDRPELAAIAGTAVGALAGGVTSVLTGKRERDD